MNVVVTLSRAVHNAHRIEFKAKCTGGRRPSIPAVPAEQSPQYASARGRLPRQADAALIANGNFGRNAVQQSEAGPP